MSDTPWEAASRPRKTFPKSEHVEWLISHGFKEDRKCREAVSPNNSTGIVWKRTFKYHASTWTGDYHTFYLLVFHMDGWESNGFSSPDGWMAQFGKDMHWHGGTLYDSPQEAVQQAAMNYMHGVERDIAALCETRVCANMAMHDVFGMH